MNKASPIHSTEFVADRLADFAIHHKAFPPEVRNEAKRLVLDQLACQIASASFPWSAAYLRAIRSLGEGDGATVVYFGDTLPLDQAVFVNSTLGHGSEYDDTQLVSSNHSGAVVVPPVLAIAENKGLSGAAVVDALIVGLEIAIRAGTATVPHMFNRGHHIPVAAGPFGSAAASSRIMGHDTETCVNALAIAGSHAGGHLEYTHTGGSVKRCHCAIAATGGLRSSVMAANGITGPRSVFEGERGFLKTFAGEYDLSVLTDGLGEKYHLLDTSYKTIASPYSAHGCLQAFDLCVREANLKAEDIESIEISTSSFTIKNVGSIIEPKGVLEAHFSLAFGCAVRLFRGGNGVYDYRHEDLADPRFLDIARRVVLKADPVAEEERVRLNARPATVRVSTRDGRLIEQRVVYSKGHPKNPLSHDELTAKFNNAVVPRLGEARAAEIAERVWKLESADNIGELIRLTVGASRD
jgi:2-methylcitrate dehydratase PrpD